MQRVLILLLSASIFLPACTKLEVVPRSASVSEQFFADEGAYRAFLARLYAGLAVSGQQGPAGKPDLQNVDEGFSSYLRQYWQLQELTTEMAVIGWSDEGLPDLHEHRWTSDNQFVRTMYNRIFFQIAQANEFLRQTTPEKLRARGVSPEVLAEIPAYRAEARFLRALSYWHGIDLFGRLPFYTEATELGTQPVPQVSRAVLFTFLEEELRSIEALLPSPGMQEYGRADRAAVWALQAKLYLNAVTYTGKPHYEACLVACRRIIEEGGFALEADYPHLFGADNHRSPEIIFAIPFDGANTQTWGGMTYLVHAALGGDMDPVDYGVRGGWAGLRTTATLVRYFYPDGEIPSSATLSDSRAQFYTTGQRLEIEHIVDFRQGYALPKYTNLTTAGEPGKDEIFPDTDFPLFRLADVYLMYAEAILRGAANGSRAQAVEYLNALRLRAMGNQAPLLTEAELTLDYILAERARELHWEGHRRTDRIRFGVFSSAGVWPWKGGVAGGRTTESYRDLFPIPEAEILANPALAQNTGY